MDLGTCVHRINYINTQLHHSPRDTLVRVFSLPLLKSFCFVYTFIISIGAKKLWSISSVFTLFFLIPYSTIVKFQKVPEKWMGLSLPPNRWLYPPIQHHSTHSVDKNWMWRLHQRPGSWWRHFKTGVEPSATSGWKFRLWQCLSHTHPNKKSLSVLYFQLHSEDPTKVTQSEALAITTESLSAASHLPLIFRGTSKMIKGQIQPL